MDQVKRQSLSVLVNNEAGVLSQVSRMFSRKGYNIESLAVGTTEDPTVSRITIEVMADEKQTNLLCNQLRKLLPVHSVKLLDLEKTKPTTQIWVVGLLSERAVVSEKPLRVLPAKQLSVGAQLVSQRAAPQWPPPSHSFDQVVAVANPLRSPRHINKAYSSFLLSRK